MKSCDSSFLLFLLREAGREVSLDIAGTSMEPFLAAGDRVTVRSVRPEQLNIGDVILFRENGRLIVHRLIMRKGPGTTRLYCQKGDNLTGWAWISGDAIIGKVVSFRGSEGEVNMCDAPWRWLNPVLGAWGAGRVALKSVVRTAKAAASRFELSRKKGRFTDTSGA